MRLPPRMLSVRLPVVILATDALTKNPSSLYVRYCTCVSRLISAATSDGDTPFLQSGSCAVCGVHVSAFQACPGSAPVCLLMMTCQWPYCQT